MQIGLISETTKLNKMKKLFATFILATIFIVKFSSCKKNVSTDPRFDGSIQLKLSLDGLEYVKLIAGKYFIYKDSASATLDSVVVTKSVLENKYTPPTPGSFLGIPTTFAAYNTEVYSLILSKVESGGNQSVWLNASSKTALCCPSLSQNNLPVIMYDLNNVQVFLYPNSQLIPTLIIEGKSYNNVIRTTNQINLPAISYKGDTYWAKGVGIIKRTYTIDGNSKTYTLIRNN